MEYIIRTFILICAKQTKKILKKTYDEQARARKEYDDLIQTK